MEGETLALAGSAGKVHSELEQVQQQMADTPLFAPEVEAALEVMYHRLLKKKDEGMQTSFVLTQGVPEKDKPDTAPSKEVPPSTPARSVSRGSVPRSRSGNSPQSRERGWDPYFSRGEPSTPQRSLQHQLIEYYDKHNHEIERAERRLEAELRGIDGHLRRRRNSRSRTSHSPSPQRLYQMGAVGHSGNRPKNINYKSVSPKSEKPRIASPGYAAHTPPMMKQPSLYDSTPLTLVPDTPQEMPNRRVHPGPPLAHAYNSPPLMSPQQVTPMSNQFISSPQHRQPTYQGSPPSQQIHQQPQQPPQLPPQPYPSSLTRDSVQRQITASLHTFPPQAEHSPEPQFNSSYDIEAKLRHIREQLRSSSPQRAQEQFNPRAQSAPAAFPPHAPQLVRLQNTAQQAARLQKHEVLQQPHQQQPPQKRPESPTIKGPNVDSVLDMLHRSKTARREQIHYDPRHQPPPLPMPAQSRTPRRTPSPKKLRGVLATPKSKTVALQEPRKSSPPPLSMEEVIERAHRTMTPAPEVSAVSLATSDSTTPSPIAAFVQDMPPPVPSPPVMSPREPTVVSIAQDVQEGSPAMPSYNPSIRPQALPKAMYNARRKWEHVTYSDDATRRLMALRDEAKEYANEAQHKIDDYTKSLAKQVTETVPQQMDKTESEVVEYPPPPRHRAEMDKTEVEETTGALGILEDIKRKFKTHQTSGESLLQNVKNIDALVEQKELEERTMPEAREENVKEGCLRTLRRGKGDDKELVWKDVWVEADSRELRFYPIHESKHGRGREKPLGRVRYIETARLAEDLGNDGVYYYFGLERHSDAKVSLFTLCTSSQGSRRSWCAFFKKQMHNADAIRLGQLPTKWSEEQPYDEIEP
eukprot:TRINITY_DN12893_c0_g1_i1.p1 TRINITY_DN12893_c0_g1~~TRINITY_DN12893_c0_g1_i1.p1  ORF type:complete len:875 (+),score=219.53 TRINITY_DN12893_c0_g1_i1:36-2627(+)